MSFLDDLDVILDSIDVQKKYDIRLNDAILTKAIDALLPDPFNFQINYLILFDIEFYTLINNAISKFGFIATDDTNKVCNLVREFTILVLERTKTDNDHYWTLKRSVFFNINNEYFYKALYFIRQNHAKSYVLNKSLSIGGPYLRMLSRYFMTVDDEYDTELDNKLLTCKITMNKDQFVQKLNQKVNNNTTTITDNYLAYSDHRYYMGDHDLTKYHDSVMSTYVNNNAVKKRELTALQTLKFFKLLKLYEKKISVVHKGQSDIKAINNTYKLFDWIEKYDCNDGKFRDTVSSYQVDSDLEITFQNAYDLVYFNGMSHVLYKSAKLSITCHKMVTSQFYKHFIENNTSTGVQSFKEIIALLDGKNPHDPNYDVLCTLIVVILIHLSTLSVFQ